MSSVYLIFGEDEYQVVTKAQEIVYKLVPEEDRALGLEVIDGRVDTVDAACGAMKQCFEALQTVGFFGAEKVIWFKGVTFFSDNVTGKSASVKPLVEQLAEEIKGGIAEGLTLVISAAKVNKKYKFYKTCKAVAELHEFEVSDKSWQNEKDTVEFLRGILEEQGLKMNRAAGTAFLEKVGTNSRFIANEVEKLAVYVGDRKEITLSDIESITSSARSAVSWDLADAFGNRDMGKALLIVRQLLFQKESTIGMVMGINSRIKDLMVYRQALDNGWLRIGGGQYGKAEWTAVPHEVEEMLSEQMGRDPRKTHPFRAKTLAQQASKFKMIELKRCYRTAVETHEQLVSSSMPDDITLELMLVKMLR